MRCAAAGSSVRGAESSALNAAADRAGKKEGAFWTTELRRVARAPTMREIMLEVGPTLGDRSIIAGRQSPARNPFTVGKDGALVLAVVTRNADGSIKSAQMPGITAWDQVQRIIRGKIGEAERAGNREKVNRYTLLHKALVDELDDISPRFREARSTAYRGFHAEDAYEAGENYVSKMVTGRDADALSKQIKSFTASDRVLFKHGFARSLIERVMETGDSAPVINRIYQTPKARERVVEALGEKNAKELETYLHVLRIQGRGKNAVQGNSSTTEQLRDVFMSMGREAALPGVAGAATAAAHGDFSWSTILAGASVAGGVAGGRHYKRKLSLERDKRIATHIGDMLASNDPDVFRRGVAILASHERFMDRIRNFATPVSKAAAPQTTDVDLGLGELSKQPAPAN